MFPLDNGLLSMLMGHQQQPDPNSDNFAGLFKAFGLGNPSGPVSGTPNVQNPLQSMGGNDEQERDVPPRQNPVMPMPSDPMLGFASAQIPQNPMLDPNAMVPPMSQMIQPLSPQMLNFLQQVFSSNPGQMNMPPMGAPPAGATHMGPPQGGMNGRA